PSQSQALIPLSMIKDNPQLPGTTFKSWRSTSLTGAVPALSASWAEYRATFRSPQAMISMVVVYVRPAEPGILARDVQMLSPCREDAAAIWARKSMAWEDSCGVGAFPLRVVSQPITDRTILLTAAFLLSLIIQRDPGKP